MFSGNRLGRVWPSAGAVSAVLLCGLIGCGPSEPFEMLPVSGKVIYEDASLKNAARIRIVFESQAEPIDRKTHPRPGEAEGDPADGTFSAVTSRKYGDGLVVGKHKVRVLSYDEDEKQTECEVTPSEIEVGPESTEFEFKLKKR